MCIIPIDRPPVCGYNDVVSHKIQAHKGGESMAKKFLKWLVKEVIAPIIKDTVKSFTDAILERSSLRINGKHFQYGYNCAV